jgi:hypothetical protein
MTASASGDNNAGFAAAAYERRFLIAERTRLVPSMLPEEFISEIKETWIEAPECSNWQFAVYRNPNLD